MQIVSAFLAAVGFVGTVLGIANWYFSYAGTVKRRDSRLFTIIAAIIFLTFLFASLSLGIGNNGSGTQSRSINPQNNVTPTAGITATISSTPTPTPTVTPTPTTAPTPTPTPTPTLIPTPTPFTYVAGWSRGPNGWAVTDVWSVYSGALHSSRGGEIPFPFQLDPSPSRTTDYTVEWKSTAIDNSGGFGVTVRAANDGTTYGYHISFNDEDINQIFSINIFNGPGHIYGDHSKVFTVGPGEHDFIVSVKADLITIKVDGSQVMQVRDNTFPIGGSSSFLSGGQVNITYLKVTQQ